MGIGVALFLHLMLYAILAALLSFIARLVRSQLPSGRSALTRALGIGPFVLAGVPFAVFVGSILWNNFAPPRCLYQEVFNAPAAFSMEHLQGYSSAINDSQEVFLSFEDTDAVFNQMLGTGRFEPLGMAMDEEMVPMPGNILPPGWWVASECPNRAVYYAKKVRYWDEIVITRCRTDGKIYVQARWTE